MTLKPGLYIKTFGCQMNEYDSEKLFGLLADSHQPVTSPEEATVVLVNTCSVREKGEHKLRSLLGRLRELKAERPETIVGVGGCVAQQEGNKIIQAFPTVDFVFGTHNLSLVPSLVVRAKAGVRRQVAVDYREDWEELPDLFIDSDAQAPTQSSQIQALIAVQRGCNKHCSFCVVPTTRGPEVSRAPAEILREVSRKVRIGAKEVVLLGQTVNSYGRDLTPRYSFEELVKAVSEIAGVRRIRFISPHPQDVRPEFVKLYSELPTLCPHIHLPLQSGSDRILKLMNRNYRVKRYLEIVQLLKSECPGIAISTDIIVGFPTETEEDFQQTLRVMQEVRYISSYSFKYSKRPNTTALRHTAEVESEVADRRLAELQQVQRQITEEINVGTIGKTVQVLVEGPSKRISSLMRGRNLQNVPVKFSGEEVAVGDEVEVMVTGCGAFGLDGQLFNGNAMSAFNG